MPDQPLYFPSEREIIVASILRSRLDLRRLQYDLHDTASRSREGDFTITGPHRKGRRGSSAKISCLYRGLSFPPNYSGSLAILAAIPLRLVPMSWALS